jgi:two-component system KDP operon response regulator KdpE
MTQVLVVDDSDTMRQLVRSMLEPEGYDLSEAADGVEGLAALRARQTPQVVLLDYRMPNMDGWELLQEVAAAGAPLTTNEFVVITADAATFPTASIDLLRHVSVRVLPKPFGRDVLVATVAQAVERLTAPVSAPLFEEAEG